MPRVFCLVVLASLLPAQESRAPERFPKPVDDGEASINAEDVSYQSSAIAAINTWKSPVLLVHGDDDRNVAFQQTTGLVQLLRAHDIPYELIVLPDDVHDTLIHARWLQIFGRMDEFISFQ